MANIPMGGNPTNGQMGYQPTPNFPQYPPQNAAMGYAPPPQSAPQPIPQEQSVQQAPAPSPAPPHEPHHHAYGPKEKGNRNQETESLLSQIQDHSRHGNSQSVSMDAIKEGNRSNALKNRLDKIETEKRNIEDAVEKEITKINEEEREYVDIVTKEIANRFKAELSLNGMTQLLVRKIEQAVQAECEKLDVPYESQQRIKRPRFPESSDSDRLSRI